MARDYSKHKYLEQVGYASLKQLRTKLKKTSENEVKKKS